MSNAKKVLQRLGLRPTSQRLIIVKALLQGGNIHITAPILKALIKKNKINISTATIYNNLNELTERGFLKKVLVAKDRMWFDTNIESHHHFYDEEENTLTDVNKNDIKFSSFPTLPKGKKIDSVNVTINIKKEI